MYNYSLDEKLLPEVWVTWLNKDGRVWMDKSGARQNRPEPWMDYDDERSMSRRRSNNGKCPFGCTWVTRNNNRIWVASGSKPYFAYAKYHEDIDRLEIAAVRYDTTRSEQQHTWMYDACRFFIGKDKSIVNINGQPVTNGYYVKRGDNVEHPSEMLGIIGRLNYNEKFVDEFKKFLGRNYFIIGNGTSVNVTDGWHLQKWYASKERARSKGKAQKMVDELVKIPLGSIEGLEYKYIPKLKDSHYNNEDAYIRNIIYFERANDEWSVLRALVRDEDGCFEEVWRVYLGDDGTSRITTKVNGDWVPSSQQIGWHYRNQYYFANEAEAMEKCDRIKYIAPIISNESVQTLITTLRFPCIEQLYKIGKKQLAMRVAHSGTPKAEMKAVFGYYNEKEKSVLRQIGMTKHQLDAYCEKIDVKRYYCGEAMKKMREVLGDDLSHIDNATYDKYLDTFDEILSNFWGRRTLEELNIDNGKFWKNVARLYEKNKNVSRLISDALCTYRYLNDKPTINWMFDDYSDIVRAHNAIVALKNEQDARQRAYWNMSEAERRRKDEEKRKKTDGERKHYEYEDENFIIRLPKDVSEIVTEGTLQSICIGSYTTRHSNGDTNLFFLRKKSDVDTPFYAIEMNNDKNIVQIHGSFNKWLGNNPEAIPTVVRWLRKHDIKCDAKILTCTSKGYSHKNEYIEMPQVD